MNTYPVGFDEILSRDMLTFAVDFETSYSKGRDIKALGVLPYLEHPETVIYLVSIVGPGVNYSGPVETAPWAQISNHHWVSHNAAFDAACFMTAKRRGQIAADIFPGEWDCTANLAAFLAAPRALDKACAQLLGLVISKATRDAMKGKQWIEMTPEFKAEVMAYALKDSEMCLAIWTRYNAQWPAIERRHSRHTMAMCLNGIATHMGRIEEGIAVLTQALWATEQKIPWSGELNAKGVETPIMSRNALLAECVKRGIPQPLTTADKDERFIAWMERYEEQADFVKAVKEYRSINRTIEIFKKLRDQTRSDGRIRYSQKYFGAHCVTGDHEVLTRSGWVRIEQWTGGEIAQWSPDGVVSFRPASANRFANEQEIYRIAAPFVAGVFTAGHTIPTTTDAGVVGSAKAESLALKSYFRTPVSGALDHVGAITADQMRLLVAVQADGHWTKYHELQFCLRKPRKITRIQTLLTTLGIPFRLSEFPSTKGQVRVSVSRRHCPAWLSEDRKFFGAWLLDSTPEARQAFVEEFPHWDGYRHATNAEYYSGSPSNVEWVATMLHLTGRSSGAIRERDGSFAVAARNRNRAMVFAKHWTKLPAAVEPVVFCPTTETGFWLYRYNGTIAVTGNTGRSSGDSGLNFANLTKGNLYFDAAYNRLNPLKMSKAELKARTAHVVDLRGCFIAGPGKKLIVADLSQIEAVMALWFADDTAQLDLFRAGLDIYEAHARSKMGYKMAMALKDYCASPSCPEKDKNIRQFAKCRVLGLGFGMGFKKFIITVALWAGITITEAQAKQIVNDYRASNPGIVRLWGTLDRAMRSHAAKGDKSPFHIELPSWRKLSYFNVNGADDLKAQDEMGGLFNYYYGGILFQNLVQATARDVLVEAIDRIENAGFSVILHVYDEVVCEVDMDVPVDAIAALMTTTPDWCPGLPVRCSASETDRYMKD